MPGRGERSVGEVAGSQVAQRLGVVTGALVESGCRYLMSAFAMIVLSALRRFLADADLVKRSFMSAVWGKADS